MTSSWIHDIISTATIDFDKESIQGQWTLYNLKSEAYLEGKQKAFVMNSTNAIFINISKTTSW